MFVILMVICALAVPVVCRRSRDLIREEQRRFAQLQAEWVSLNIAELPEEIQDVSRDLLVRPGYGMYKGPRMEISVSPSVMRESGIIYESFTPKGVDDLPKIRWNTLLFNGKIFVFTYGKDKEMRGFEIFQGVGRLEPC